MNEGGFKQPHDDREEGSEEKGQSEDEGDLLTEPITGKRRHVRSWRMQEYLQQQDKTLPQKQRKCPYPGCEKQFSSAPGLRYHLRTHSPNARHFCCDRCKKEFKSHNGLKYHLQRTKCPDTPVDVPPPPPPPSPPHQHHQQHSPPPSLPCLPSPAECEGSANRRSSSEKDETDSMYDTALGLPVQDWPEPRHRKMESRRKQMLLAAQAKTVEAEPQLASAQPTRRPQPLEPVGSSGADKRLLDFATIATGPQSPLMTTKRIDWEPARVVGCDSTMKDAIASDICVNVSPLSTSASTPVTSTVTHTTATSLQAESDTKALESSSPLHSSPKESDCVGSWSSTWPTAVWQCFIKGTKVHLGGEDAALPWHLVETVAVSHLQEHSFTLPEDLRQPVPLRLVSQQKSVEQDDQVELRFESQSSHQSCLTACCMLHHPFFVRDKGWASCNSEKTKAVYGLHSSHLEIGDICLPPCYSQQIPASKDSEGSEVNSLEYSSVVALSSMAQQKRGQEGSLGQQMSPVSPSRQQAPKAKRPMNAFLLWSQTKRPEFITKFPRTNNRDISSMLSKEWRKLSDSEKKQLQNEAKVKAEYQKQQHPDCWKRKHARRDHR